jgi:hypothetical protein
VRIHQTGFGSFEQFVVLVLVVELLRGLGQLINMAVTIAPDTNASSNPPAWSRLLERSRVLDAVLIDDRVASAIDTSGNEVSAWSSEMIPDVTVPCNSGGTSELGNTS